MYIDMGIVEGLEEFVVKTEPTKEQNELALKILIHVSHDKFNARLVTRAECEKLTFKDNTDNSWWLLSAFVVDGRYWCGWDVYFGHDIVVDLMTKSAKSSKQGIFEPEYVFISDYYGYEKGNFYYATN